MRERVSFDYPVETPDGSGGTETGWSALPDSIERPAEFIYSGGGESVEASRLTGSFAFKVRIRNGAQSKTITSAWRMRDLKRGEIYNVREVDAVTNRAWVYLVVEGGAAT